MIRALKVKAGKHRIVHGKSKPVKFTVYKTGDILPYDEKLASESTRFEIIEVVDNFFSSEGDKTPLSVESSSKRRRDGGESK